MAKYLFVIAPAPAILPGQVLEECPSVKLESIARAAGAAETQGETQDQVLKRMLGHSVGRLLRCWPHGNSWTRRWLLLVLQRLLRLLLPRGLQRLLRLLLPRGLQRRLQQKQPSPFLHLARRVMLSGKLILI
jgi:hypothetical protein